MKLIYIVLLHLLFINILAVILYAIDKRKAKRGESRVSEKSLILVALFGGSIGAAYAMRRFRHKTQHKKFVIGIPLIIILQVALILYIIWHRYLYL